MAQEHEHWLLVSGLFLFLLGLINGAFIQRFKNARMALSAHLTGVQNGMVLLIFGFLWPHITLEPLVLSVSFWFSIFSMYSIWLALFLAAVWGTSRSTPIAGAGYTATKTQEQTASFLLVAGSIAIILVTLALLYGLLSG